jgi:D-alanyl-D-alanine dipeptidase
MDFLLIGDPRIESIPVRENGESIVDFSKEFPELFFDSSRLHVQKVSSSIFFGRKKLGQMLTDAQRLLPPGYKFLIKECYRPLSVQRSFWVKHEAFLKSRYPNWTDEEIRLECSKYIAPLSVAPHSTGGAVDLLLTDLNGRWLDMGSDFNAKPENCEYRTYFASDKISEEARVYREILSNAMTSVGFVNYPTEWWHWSCGDKYWAYATKAEAAIFSSIDIDC